MSTFKILVLLLLSVVFLLVAVDSMLAQASFSCNITFPDDPLTHYPCHYFSATIPRGSTTEELTCRGNTFALEMKLQNNAKVDITCPWTSKTLALEGIGVFLAIIVAISVLLGKKGEQVLPDNVALFIGITTLLLLIAAVATMVISLMNDENESCKGKSEDGIMCYISLDGFHKTPALTLFSSCLFGLCVYFQGKKSCERDEAAVYWLPK